MRVHLGLLLASLTLGLPSGLGCGGGSNAPTTSTDDAPGAPVGSTAPTSPANPAPSPTSIPDASAPSSPSSPSTPVTTPPPGPVSAADLPPYPIVLMHGFAGFNQLNGPVPLTYFNGVVADLASIGETEVFVTIASPYDTSENRAAQIQPQLEAILAQTGKSKVNLIGHSQGGMDARVLASPNGLGMGDKIASVTMVSTPNLGTPLADLAMLATSGVPNVVYSAVTDAFLGLLEATVYDVQTTPALRAQVQEMSTAYMASTFNPRYIDDPRVAYTSYGGRTNLETGEADCASAIYPDDSTHLDFAQALMLPTAEFIQGLPDVTNDGVVPVKSARWGTFLQCIPADHMNEVGWFEPGTDPLSGFSHLLFYRTAVARIRSAGF